MMRRILLGYDGSESASHALEFAVDLARRCGAELHLLAVARPPEFGDEVETAAVIENGQRQCEKVLAAARARLAQEGLQTAFRVAVGHPAEQIVRDAEAHAIDHIVVAQPEITPALLAVRGFELVYRDASIAVLSRRQPAAAVRAP